MAVGGAIAAVTSIWWTYSRCYAKTAPNSALIVSGRSRVYVMDGERHEVGFRVVMGGGTVVWPVVERVDTLSLELITLEITTPVVYTVEGVPIVVDSVAQIKVRSDEASVITAAERLLSKPQEEMRDIAHEALEGHLRGILATMTVEEINSKQDVLGQKVA